jgi:hypothetical protein
MGQAMLLQFITDDEIKQADWIRAVSPTDQSESLTIWGDDVVPPLSKPGSSARLVRTLDIDCQDQSALVAIIARVKALRGRVSSKIPDPPQLVRHETKAP